MKSSTIAALNRMNTAFYETVAAPFDATRQVAWAGWERLLPHIPSRRPLRVLDVGCGNGRFGVFLSQHVQGEIRYHGIDKNAALLEAAEAALQPLPLYANFTQRDIVTQTLVPVTYDLVVLFGVVHHIPSLRKRQAFLREMAGRVVPNGVMSFAAWRFMDVPRLRAKVGAWPEHLEREDNDYILDWKREASALRYCHFVDDNEHDALVTATGLQELDRYRADGHDGATNQYSILRRPPIE